MIEKVVFLSQFDELFYVIFCDFQCVNKLGQDKICVLSAKITKMLLIEVWIFQILSTFIPYKIAISLPPSHLPLTLPQR